MFVQADKNLDITLAQTSGSEVSNMEEDEINLAEISPVVLPTQPDQGSKYILDAD